MAHPNTPYGRRLEGAMNLQKHAISDNCTDPDCEVHNPEMIEDEAFRATAKAYYIAGAFALADLMVHTDSIDAAVGELVDAHNLLLTP